jgi:hypothetical protein
MHGGDTMHPERSPAAGNRTMSKRLLDEDTALGKAIRGVVGAAKVLVVLLFFFGAFVVIAIDSLILRFRNRSMSKRASRKGGTRASRRPAG